MTPRGSRAPPRRRGPGSSPGLASRRQRARRLRRSKQDTKTRAASKAAPRESNRQTEPRGGSFLRQPRKPTHALAFAGGVGGRGRGRHARAATKTLPRQVPRRKARATSTLRVRTPGAIYSLDSREKHSSARYNPPPSARPPALLHGALAQARAASRRAAPRGQSPGQKNAVFGQPQKV